MSSIYLPGQGLVDIDVARAHAASQEYDRRCSFKRHPESGQWCNFMQMPRGFDPPEVPVKGWDHIPTPDEVKKFLSESDAEKHGDKLRQNLNARNEKRKGESRYAQEQKDGEAAEYMDHIIRKGGDHPFHRSLRKVGPKHG